MTSNKKLCVVCCFLVISILFASHGTMANAQVTEGKIKLEVKSFNGDRIGYEGLKFVVYQRLDDTPYLEKTATYNPDIIDHLPIDQQYKIEVYVNNMYAGVIYVDLQNSEEVVEIKIPLSGGLRLDVFYDDGATPLPDVTVKILSRDGTEWASSITNSEGETLRHWLQSTTRNEDYYIVEVFLDEILIHTESNIHLQAVSTNLKVVTPVPKIIQDLITVYVYKDSSTKVGNVDGEFTVGLIDKSRNKITVSKVNTRGEAYFSNVIPGQYFLQVFEKSNNNEFVITDWPEISFVIIEQNKFEIFKAEPQEEGLSTDAETPINSCNCVAFRMDDIQDYWLTSAQMRVIDTLQERKIPLSIGIVGGSIGDDVNLISFIKDKLENGDAPLELYNHSFDNRVVFELSKEEQTSVITQTNDAIESVFGIKATTFVPPENLFNQQTIEVLQENGITHLSASYLTDSPPYPLTGSEFYHFPQTAGTGKFLKDTDEYFGGIANEVTFSDVMQSIEKYGYAVVMMHPQEFSVWDGEKLVNEINLEQIKELEILLDKLAQTNIEFTTIGKINLDATGREEYVFHYTEVVTPINSCNCVAFRLDTVQDWYLADVSSAIIKKFSEKNTGLTIGLIGHLIGNDQTLVEFLQNTLDQNKQRIEIANNGFDFEDFTIFSKEEQASLMEQSNEAIKSSLGITPTVFIPPQFKFNDDTKSASIDQGFTHLSSSQTLSLPPYPISGESFYQFPATTGTGEVNPNTNIIEGIAHDVVFNEAQYSIETNGFSVVLLTPQEFSLVESGVYIDEINQNQLEELDKLIEKIKSSDIKIVPISRINLDSDNYLVIPEWIKNNASWWSSGQIGDSDFVSGIQYLIEKGIMIIPETAAEEQTATVIPEWVRNNAGWWSDGLIEDSDFVSGIQWLITKGIITI